MGERFMFGQRMKLRIVLSLAGFMVVLANTAVAVELAPNPNPRGSNIAITGANVESHGEPYENFGGINIESGGVLTNFLEFANEGSVNVKTGGRLVNDATGGVFVIDGIGSLINSGTIDNNGRLKNSWNLSNRSGSVFNNNAGAELTNTGGMDQRGTLINAGSFLNSADSLSGDGAVLQNVGQWTNQSGSTFVNLGTFENFSTVDNSGVLTNRVAGSGSVTQGRINNRSTFNNLADGVVSNQYRWFNRAGSVLNNSGIFTSERGMVGISVSNESGSTINNLAGGTFNTIRSIKNLGAITNAGTFNVGLGSTVGNNTTGTYTQTDGTTVLNETTFATSTLGGTSIDFQGGVVTGTGTLSGLVFIGMDATIDPGASSPGILTVDGDIDLGGILAIELGDLITFDILDITGTATLGGTLDVSYFDPGGGLFAPGLGDSFDILSANTIAGEFDLLSLAMLGDGLGWDVNYILDDFGTDFVRLNVISAVPVPPTVWLFASGLLGLAGIAKRKTA